MGWRARDIWFGLRSGSGESYERGQWVPTVSSSILKMGVMKETVDVKSILLTYYVSKGGSLGEGGWSEVGSGGVVYVVGD